MKIFPSLLPAARRYAFCLVLLVAASLCQGCATTREIKSIVAESNAELLAAQLPDFELGSDPTTSSKPQDPAVISRKIDAFIAAHPDEKVAASALRVRQAMLLIVSGKYELARAAFAEATELKTDRDKALKALSEPIIWWWEHSQVTALDTAQQAKAREHLDAFDQQLKKLSESPDIRDLLAEMRARIALKRVSSLQLSQGKKDAFIDALNHYSAIFTADDIAALKSENLAPQTLAISAAERRRLRATTVIPMLKKPCEVLRTANQPVATADLDPAARDFGELVLGH